MRKYDEEKIKKELEVLRRTDLTDKILDIADFVTKNRVTDRKIRAEVKDILKELFGKGFEKSVSVPLNFMETVTGEILFTAFYNLEPYVTITDIVEMTGLSRQWIWQCVQDGRIKGGAKFGRDYVFPASAVNDLIK